jgi:hypothetical protein
MVRTLLLVSVVQAAVAASASAQAPATSPAEPIKLTGCLSTKPTTTGDYTFTNEADGNQYRLTGKDSRKHAGRKIEVVEAMPDTKKLQVRGGLYPSPNVAGQAGDLDPVQAAIATQRGGNGPIGPNATLPEIRASRVRVLDGTCQ